MGLLAAIGSGLDCSGTAHFPRTGVASFDRGRSLAGGSLAKADILVRLGTPGLDNRVRGRHPLGC